MRVATFAKERKAAAPEGIPWPKGFPVDSLTGRENDPGSFYFRRTCFDASWRSGLTSLEETWQWNSKTEVRSMLY